MRFCIHFFRFIHLQSAAVLGANGLRAVLTAMISFRIQYIL